MDMSTPPAPAEKVTIDGKTYNVKICNRCQQKIYWVNVEPDRAKAPIWEMHNATDGSVHQPHEKKSGSGGWTPRPPTPKFVLRIKKTLGTTEVEMTADCTSYDDLKSKFDESVKKES